MDPRLLVAGVPGLVRALFDLSRMPAVLALVGFVMGLLMASAISLWHRHVRRVASSILAIAAIPVFFITVAKVPLFDPWLWYAMVYNNRFEGLAASRSPPGAPKYAVIEGIDVSTGMAGVSPNLFVFLIYDESDAVGLDPTKRPSIWRTRTLNTERDPKPPIPRGRRLYGHLFRVDDFE